MALIRASLRLILIVNQVRNHIRLANIDQEAVPYDDGSLELSECTVAFPEVSNFVESVQRIELNVKLTALVVVAAAHHRIDRRLVLTSIRVVRVIARNNEVIHLFLQNLLASGILDIASSSSSSIFAADVVFVVLDSIFYTEICKTIELLSSRTVFVAGSIERLSLRRHNTSRIDYHGEVLFKMGRRQHFQLECLDVALLNQLSQHLLPSLGVLLKVILDLLRFEHVEVLFAANFLLVSVYHVPCVLCL